ncbi:MAG TPA: nucleotidyltransferase family protein, partial [Acidothermaceae bacterium]|nr:nucleotidyltransferase family protein [Acidothermaceae bacterium]
SRSGLVRACFGGKPGHPVAIERRHWSSVMATVSGDRGAASYLRTTPDVEVIDCSDLAGGEDHDEPA